ncbi:MAG: tRNA sulfurtransferase [Halodesulfurarchaeum sp.]
MEPPGADVVVVRHGDIGVKSSRVQSRMERRLAENLAELLADRGVPGTVEREWGRLFVRTEEPGDAAEEAADAFGVVSTSPARSVTPDLDAICEVLANTAREHYDGGSFAVDARRTGGQDFTSQDVGAAGGEAIWTAVEDDVDPSVDLDDPDITFSVEVRESEAFVFLETIDGPGGLPVGSQRPLVSLVSGGIDSPVAGWLAMKRGSPILPLYFDLGQYGGPDHRQRALATIERLADFAPNQNWQVIVSPIGPYLEQIEAELDDLRMLVLRRLMLEVAERVAKDRGAVGLVTGEAIGQKSSQTAANLAVTDRVTTLPVHRPLSSWNKQEIISLARDIGTYEDATIQAGCNRIAPDRPETRADPSTVDSREPEAMGRWAEEAFKRSETVDLHRARSDVGGIEQSR